MSSSSSITIDDSTSTNNASSIQSSSASSLSSSSSLSSVYINELVARRVSLRSQYLYAEADSIRSELLQHGIEIFDIPMKQGGGSTWKYVIHANAFIQPIHTLIGNQFQSNSSNNVDGNVDDNAVVSSGNMNPKGEAKDNVVHPKSLMDIAHHAYQWIQSNRMTEQDIVSISKQYLQQYHHVQALAKAVSNPPSSSSSAIQSSSIQSSSSIDSAAIVSVPSDVISSNIHYRIATSREMQGRKFADCAFEFAMAGINDNELFSALANGAEQELLRFGRRKSCRPVDIYQIVEKLAVAGWVDQRLYQLAAEILASKLATKPGTSSVSEFSLNALRSGQFHLLSERPLLCLWRFAAKQKKSGKQTNSSLSRDKFEAIANSVHVVDSAAGGATIANEISLNCLETSASIANHDCYERIREKRKFSMVDAGEQSEIESDSKIILSLFKDSVLPLVVDVGCGYGVSTIGLAKWANDHSADRFNFLGCDLSHRAIAYAKSIISRWNMTGHCQFIYMEAGECLRLLLANYPGPIVWISVNFPTPYQLEAIYPETMSAESVEVEGESLNTDAVSVDDIDDRGSDADLDIQTVAAGNSQLPKTLDHFMCSPSLIDLCRQCLGRENNPSLLISARIKSAELPRGLLLQSNVEDVTITMHRLVTESHNFGCLGGFKATSGKGTAASEEGGGPLWSRIDDVVSSSLSEPQSQAADVTIQHAYDAPAPRLSQRDDKWVTAFPHIRAVNLPAYVTSNPLPKLARTETEIACAHEGKTVHRALFEIVMNETV